MDLIEFGNWSNDTRTPTCRRERERCVCTVLRRGRDIVIAEIYASMVTLAVHVSPGCKTMGLTATAFSTQMKSL